MAEWKTLLDFFFFLEFQMAEQKKKKIIEICIELTDFPSEFHIKVFLNVLNVRSRLTLLWTTSFQSILMLLSDNNQK